MNHSGDTNKMVGEDVSNEQVTGEATPNEELRRQILSQCVAKNEREWWAARTVERLEFELNAANQRIRLLIAKLYKYQDRIKRLEEAGDDLYANSYSTRWDSMQAANRKLKEQDAWRKAKEAKP